MGYCGIITLISNHPGVTSAQAKRLCGGFSRVFPDAWLGKTIPPTEASCPSVLDLLIVAINTS